MPDRVAGTVVAVVVTYHPDLSALGALLAATQPQVAAIVVVDNGSDVPAVGAVVASHGAELVPLGANLGIAAAQNVGIGRARALGASTVLLLDQDSVPGDDMVGRLGSALERAGDRTAAVGAIAQDDRDGEPPFVYAARRHGPRRVDLPAADGALVPVAFLIASGCLIDVRALDDVGLMREDLFIDHVDLEWGVRARNAGWSLYAVVGARLRHELGEAPRTVPGRSRTVHVQSVVRNYYMVRNTVVLIRWPGLPAAWRWGYLRWLAKYVGYYTIAVAPRRRRVPLMARGVIDAVRGRMGALG